jgi:thioredoxin 1
MAVHAAPVLAEPSSLEACLASAWPTLLVFETPNCAPCRDLAPHLQRIAEEYSSRLRVVRVQNAAEGWVAARYHLTFVPTLVFLRGGGGEAMRIRGNPGHVVLGAWVRFLLGDGPRPEEAAEGPRHTLEAPFCRLGKPVDTALLIPRR